LDFTADLIDPAHPIQLIRSSPSTQETRLTHTSLVPFAIPNHSPVRGDHGTTSIPNLPKNVPNFFAQYPANVHSSMMNHRPSTPQH
jgi:hypothetical protein